VSRIPIDEQYIEDCRAVRRWILDCPVSREELANATGVSLSSLSRMVKGFEISSRLEYRLIQHMKDRDIFISAVMSKSRWLRPGSVTRLMEWCKKH